MLVYYLIPVLLTQVEATWPQDWNGCPANHTNLNKCLKNVIQVAISDLIQGISDWNIKEIDKLFLSNMTIHNKLFSAKVWDPIARGMKYAEVKKVATFDDYMVLDVFTPMFSVLGRCYIIGNAKILPTASVGWLNLIFENLTIKAKFKMIKVVGDGWKIKKGTHIHLVLKSIITNELIKTISFHGLDEQVNKILNNRKKTITFTPPFGEILTEAFNKTVINIFSNTETGAITYL